MISPEVFQRFPPAWGRLDGAVDGTRSARRLSRLSATFDLPVGLGRLRMLDPSDRRNRLWRERGTSRFWRHCYPAVGRRGRHLAMMGRLSQ